MGGALFQYNKNNEKQYIRLFSYAFKDEELNWSTPRKELYGIKFGLEKCQDYLLGRKFTLLTDNKSLTYMQTATLEREIYRRWFETIGSFTFDITHIPGKKNVLPDAFSRLNVDSRSSKLNSCNTNYAINNIQTIEQPMLTQDQKLNILHGIHNLTHASVRKTLFMLKKHL